MKELYLRGMKKKNSLNFKTNEKDKRREESKENIY